MSAFSLLEQMKVQTYLAHSSLISEKSKAWLTGQITVSFTWFTQVSRSVWVKSIFQTNLPQQPHCCIPRRLLSLLSACSPAVQVECCFWGKVTFPVEWGTIYIYMSVYALPPQFCLWMCQSVSVLLTVILVWDRHIYSVSGVDTISSERTALVPLSLQQQQFHDTIVIRYSVGLTKRLDQ